MRCDHCRDLLGAFADAELAPNERAAVATHLDTCRDCAAEYDRMLDTSRRVKAALPRRSAPDVLVARIRGALADEPSRAGRRKHVIDVFAWPAQGGRDHAGDAFTTNGFHVVRWTSGGDASRAVSDIGVPELPQFAALFARADSAGGARRE